MADEPQVCPTCTRRLAPTLDRCPYCRRHLEPTDAVIDDRAPLEVPSTAKLIGYATILEGLTLIALGLPSALKWWAALRQPGPSYGSPSEGRGLAFLVLAVALIALALIIVLAVAETLGALAMLRGSNVGRRVVMVCAAIVLPFALGGVVSAVLRGTTSREDVAVFLAACLVGVFAVSKLVVLFSREVAAAFRPSSDGR